MSLRTSKIQVTEVPILPLYRASYKELSAYGRTPGQAIDKVKREYERRRVTVGDVVDAVGWVLISPFL